ncbi:MAG: cation:proton antiporter [Cardiobacteriaceae bacterium]|nr:cation:proton antiporter [Cardiobacteriaceae bacterium]
MTAILLYIFIYLAFAVAAVMLSQKLKLGSVLGYLLAGIVIGPVLGLVGKETESIQHVAEFGVVMMLFLVGLELAPQTLWRLRHRLLGLGGLQVALTTLALMAIAMALGQSWQIALALGCVLALSSTAIVLQTYGEKNLFNTAGGQAGFVVLLFQDVAAIPMLALLPLLAASPALHEGSEQFLANQPGWMIALTALAVIALIVAAIRYLVPFALRFLSRHHLHEMFTVFTLALVVGIAAGMSMLGLSPALGAFIAGVALANSTWRHELESHLQPFKGLLLGLFFITVGAGMNFVLFQEEWARILQFTLGMMAVKMLILWGLSWLFRLDSAARRLFVVSLAQAGEFGFVLLAIADQSRVLPPALSERIALVVALSMLLTPLMFLVYDWLSARAQQHRPHERPHDTVAEHNPVVLLGHGRYGQQLNQMLLACGIRATVIDHHPENVESLAKFGVKVYYGDATRPELLHGLGLKRARLLIVGISNPAQATEIVEFIRRHYPKLPVIARAHNHRHAYELLQAGACDIIRETTDAAIHSGRIALEKLGFSDERALRLAEFYAARERYQLHALADLHDPGVPGFANDELMAKLQSIDEDTRAMMQAMMRGEAVAWPTAEETNLPKK